MVKAGASWADRRWWRRAPRLRRLRKRRKPRAGLPWERRAAMARMLRELNLRTVARTDVERGEALERVRERRERRDRRDLERKRDEIEQRERYLAAWGREIEKKEGSLVWKTFLVWGVALVFVVVFYKAMERAGSRASCFEGVVEFEFERREYQESGLTLREWCREQRLLADEAEAAMRDYYR